MPEISALLRDVEHHQMAAESARAQYLYHVHLEQHELDGHGNLKKTVTTDADSFTLRGVRVERVTARNGKPLSADEARKEDERIDKVVARDLERRSQRQAKGELTNSRGDELITAERFLELGTFTNPRRVLLHGRPTIELDYAGDPKAKTRNAAEGAIRDLVGTLWVDEADHTLVQAQGHFLKDFKLLGGLALDIHKGFSFGFSAVKVNGEVWLPASVDAAGSARYLLFFNIHGSLRVVTSDYRKFRASATIVQPPPVDAPPETPPGTPPQQ